MALSQNGNPKIIKKMPNKNALLILLDFIKSRKNPAPDKKVKNGEYSVILVMFILSKKPIICTGPGKDKKNIIKLAIASVFKYLNL